MYIYAGLFFIALATLAFEITLSRLLSVVTWYHISFFAISVAMLGMTAGAITVFLRKKAFQEDRLITACRRSCYGFAVSVPIAVWAICHIPFVVNIHSEQYFRNIVNMLILTVLVSLPFYFSGIAVSALLTRHSLPVNRLYASDLLGASLGCITVLLGLTWLDAPSCGLLCGFVALIAAQFLKPREHVKLMPIAIVLVLTTIIVGVNTTYHVLSLHHIKGRKVNPEFIDLDRWNSFSRINVNRKLTTVPFLWGAHTPFYQDEQLPQHFMQIDGLATTAMRRYQSRADIDHLKYDVTNIAYFLRPNGGQAAIIGVGGAKDVQSALLFGYERVIGIEINPIFVDLLENDYMDFAGVGNNDKVTLIVDEARSYLSHTHDKYQIIQMSLIDTWASTSAGAFSLSENALYTTEAWLTFIDRLADDGVFTVSRWFDEQNLGETGRMMSLAVATLLRHGVTQPSAHIALITHGKVATLILSKKPLRNEDLSALHANSKALKHRIEILPGLPPRHPLLAEIIVAKDTQSLNLISDQSKFNITPPTDQSPYFFNMLKLENLDAAFYNNIINAGVLNGNLVATLTLLCLIVILIILTLVSIIVPLLIHRRLEKTSIPVASAAFFALIGAGFMSLEIAFLQRLTVFLGHPVYALSVLLFSFIASTGFGSWMSEKLPITNKRGSILLSTVTVIIVLVVHAVMNQLIGTLITYDMWVKCIAAILMIWPVGLLLGCYFPTGMSIATMNNEQATPWYWALNGIFGVLFSAVSVFISIYMGISVNVYIAVCCYALTGLCFLAMLSNCTLSDADSNEA